MGLWIDKLLKKQVAERKASWQSSASLQGCTCNKMYLSGTPGWVSSDSRLIKKIARKCHSLAVEVDVEFSVDPDR